MKSNISPVKRDHPCHVQHTEATLRASDRAVVQLQAEGVTLAARSAEDRVQSRFAGVQSPQHVDAVVPPSPNPGPTTRPQPAINHSYDAV